MPLDLHRPDINSSRDRDEAEAPRICCHRHGELSNVDACCSIVAWVADCRTSRCRWMVDGIGNRYRWVQRGGECRRPAKKIPSPLPADELPRVGNEMGGKVSSTLRDFPPNNLHHTATCKFRHNFVFSSVEKSHCSLLTVCRGITRIFAVEFSEREGIGGMFCISDL